MIVTLLILTCGLLAGLGILYTLVAALLVARFARRAAIVTTTPVPVTILKPLYGAEPRLTENLESFLDQDWDAPIQLLCGVHAESDPAFAAIQVLRARRPADDITCIVDATRHGANAKIGNLVNMMPAARHEVVIFSDSDMAAGPDYLRRVVPALGQAGVGAVTCLYHGRGDAGFWSVLGAAGLSYQFLPSVIVSLALDAGKVCMGSTIALRRATLDRIGGLARFADVLADDHAVGSAVRECGLTVVIPPMVMAHGSIDSSLGDLVRHELRWSKTVRQLSPAGYAGMVMTHPLPFALALTMLSPPAGAVLTAATLAARLLLKRAIDRFCGARTASPWLLPLRDMLSFVVFLGGFGTASVDWRGERLRMDDEGRISANAETAP